MAEGKRILVVDDEPDAIRLVCVVIEDMGDYEVITAGDGDEGFGFGHELRGDRDLKPGKYTNSGEGSTRKGSGKGMKMGREERFRGRGP